MIWWHAAIWGLAGGTAARLVSLAGTVTKADFTWPWRGRERLGPWLFVFAVELTLGGLVAAAMHSSINDAWPAFALGVGAVPIVRQLLSRIEVTERSGTGAPQILIEEIIQQREPSAPGSAERGRWS